MSDLFKEIMRELSKRHSKEEAPKGGYIFEKQSGLTIIHRISDEEKNKGKDKDKDS